ncbi:hypothetical protein N7495_006072 [Penicillium taxi]|uniref:uncharacterized protein n=1 Tax=Penicillium taxi TaxID=168475 RepID=UPI0025458921|nr:uncharacterized protein N7495_006072 [Penicillium taxi]KAJ5894381.1 hypothetical protein N7495_006072 [Penicillium taxi]
MPRNDHFRAGRGPLENNPNLELQRSHVSGALPFLNPTVARYRPAKAKTETEKETQPDHQRPTKIEHVWRSRDNRKGRHVLRVDYDHPQTKNTPPLTSTYKAVTNSILRMATYCPYWDVSYLVATIFTIGSVIWIINAFFVWLPLQDPRSEFAGEELQGGGITAFIGATVFEIGSVLLLLEAVNANQSGCFGWALETELKGGEVQDPESQVSLTRVDACQHHHANTKNLMGTGKLDHRLSHDIATGYATPLPEGKSFCWWPSLYDLRTHYMHELGFLASLIQFLAATIFWIAGFTGLPGIINHMSQGLTDGIYWVPQIVGGVGFVISGLLFTLETQKKWYIPAFNVLGWHIGVWNFIGGVGFTLCGALGPVSSSSGIDYQACLATFWGSWAFMIGSTVQWYESLQKYPVEKK